MRRASALLQADAIVSYTSSGHTALRAGHAVVVLAGMPFGQSGSTNLMQIAMA